MFRSWFHLNFLYSVRSEFTFSHVDIQFSQHRLLKKKSILSPLNSWHHCQKSIDYKYQNFVLSIELHFLSVLMPMVTTDLLFWNFDCLKRIGIIGQKTLNWIKKKKKKNSTQTEMGGTRWFNKWFAWKENPEPLLFVGLEWF